MATTHRDKALRWIRILKHQDEITPFQGWGTLHIINSYDMKTFRQKLSYRFKRNDIKCVGFVEQSRKGRHPHFHFLFPTFGLKNQIRQVILDCLPEGTQIDFQYERILSEKRNALFAYLTKVNRKAERQIIPLKGRTVFTIGKIWSKPTSELEKQTSREIATKAVRQLMYDGELMSKLLSGEIRWESLHSPHFIYWWRKGIAPTS